MNQEVGDRHLPRGDQRGGAGEQSAGDEEPRDDFDHPGVPLRPDAQPDVNGRADGPVEDAPRPVCGEEQSVDEAKQAQHGRGLTGQANAETFHHAGHVTVATLRQRVEETSVAPRQVNTYVYRGMQGGVLIYLLLLGAIFAEVIATSLLKSTEGFTRLWPTVVCLIGYAVSFALLAVSISRGMQTDVAYALWSAIGTALIVAIAVLFLGSPISVTKVVGIGLIIAGVVTLNLTGAH